MHSAHFIFIAEEREMFLAKANVYNNSEKRKQTKKKTQHTEGQVPNI